MSDTDDSENELRYGRELDSLLLTRSDVVRLMEEHELALLAASELADELVKSELLRASLLIQRLEHGLEPVRTQPDDQRQAGERQAHEQEAPARNTEA